MPGIDETEVWNRETAPAAHSCAHVEDMPTSNETSPAEEMRTGLIAAIVSLIRSGVLPSETRDAALVLVGWLARRCDGEPACARGVREASRHPTATQPVQR